MATAIQKIISPNQESQGDGISPLAALASLRVVRGFAIDNSNTRRPEQLFSVQSDPNDGILELGCPIYNSPYAGRNAKTLREGHALGEGRMQPGIVMTLPFGKSGFGKPKFSLALLCNTRQFTYVSFEEELRNSSSHPIHLVLQAISRQREDSQNDSLEWLISGNPIQASRHDGRKRRDISSASPLSHMFHDEMLQMSFHAAGEFLKDTVGYGVFCARLAIFEQNGCSRVVGSASEILTSLDLEESHPPAWLTITPTFYSTRPIPNCSNGSRFLAPWTAPIRNSHAALNIRLIASALDGSSTPPSLEEVKELVSEKNEQARRNRAWHDAPRRIALDCGERRGICYISRGIHAADNSLVSPSGAEEVLAYQSKCHEIFNTLRRGSPRPSDILWALEAYDRGRSDWPAVDLLVRLWCHYKPELRSATEQLIAKSTNLTYSPGDFALDREREIPPDFVPDRMCTEVGQFFYKLQRLSLLLGRPLRIEVEELKRGSGSLRFAARISLRGKPLHFTPWIKASSKKRCIAKASFYLLSQLAKAGVIPLELWENPLRYREGTTLVSARPKRQFSEPNGDYRRFVESVDSPLNLLRRVADTKGWNLSSNRESVFWGASRRDVNTFYLEPSGSSPLVGWTVSDGAGRVESFKKLSRQFLRALLRSELISLDELRNILNDSAVQSEQKLLS